MPFDFTQPASRRAWTKELLAPMDETKWNELAGELFAWQYARVPAYRRLCEGHEISPSIYRSWKEIPAVPQQLFKLERLYCEGLPRPTAIYETSGTTTGQPGRQHLFRTDIYQAVSTEGAIRCGLLRNEIDLHFLTSPPKQAPASSLSAMFGFWQKTLRQSGERFYVRRGDFEFARLRKNLSLQIKARRPIGLCGTAFSFVHLIDAWADLPPLRLPRGSWLLETGGFKGRSREIAKSELYAHLAQLFTVRDDAIWNEYGMSELSSQAYAHGTSGLHETPPWARVFVCDPATESDVGLGQKGLARWIDLANVDSVLALQTLDVAERTPHGFRLIGRLPRMEPRGCSLSIEDMISARGLVPTKP